MAAKRETERKYGVSDTFRVPDLTGIGMVTHLGDPDEHRLDATYYDTPGLRLATRRITLRRRTGGSDAGWHLKLPADQGDRIEIQAPLTDSHRPATDILDAVHDLLLGEPLGPIARIRTRRTERAIHGDGGIVLAVLADDQVSSQTLGERVVLQRWREIEVELVDGPRDVLDDIDVALRAAGARPPAAGSKLAQALGDRLPAEARIDPDGGDRLLSAYLLAQYTAIVNNEAGVRQGDPEAVHDMRVASRRLRSTLRSFAPVLDESQVGSLGDELKWLAQVLGGVRDGDVLADRLAAPAADLAPVADIGPVVARVRQRLHAQTATARKELLASLDSDRYAALKESVAGVAEHAEIGEVKPARLRRLVKKAVRRADRRLAAADATPAEGQPTEGAERDVLLHDARKAYKRARYAVEVVAPAAGGPARRLAKRLTALQDVLGGHQDALATAERLHGFAVEAHRDGENTFAYGLLYALQRAAADRSLEGLPDARRRASGSGVRDWLTG